MVIIAGQRRLGGHYDSCWANGTASGHPSHLRVATISVPLSAPADYSGGELVVEGRGWKLAAGDGLAFASGGHKFHALLPVTAGERVALLMWVSPRGMEWEDGVEEGPPWGAERQRHTQELQDLVAARFAALDGGAVPPPPSGTAADVASCPGGAGIGVCLTLCPSDAAAALAAAPLRRFALVLLLLVLP
eukprot:gene2651-60211_t